MRLIYGRSIVSITGDRLRERMEAVGVLQEDLADAVGCSQGAISLILQGTTRNSRFMPRIAEHLGVALPWLLGTSSEASIPGGTALLSPDEDEWLGYFRTMTPGDRKALLHIARSMNGIGMPSKQVHSPKKAYKGEEVTS